MKYELKVESIEKSRVITDGQPFLDVTVSLLDGKKTHVERKLGFPIDTDEKALKKELKAWHKQFEAEEKLAEERAEEDEADQVASETIEALEGKTL